MSQTPITFPKAARCILCCASFVAGALLSMVSVSFDAFTTAFVMLVMGLAAALAIWFWTARKIEVTPGAITFYGGKVFDTVRIVRHRTVTSAFCFATPFLRLAGCRVLIIFTYRGSVFLPGLSYADTQLLLDWCRNR